MFFADPEPLFDEMGDGSVLITPHRYAPRVRPPGAINGIYNVAVPDVPPRRARRSRRSQWWHDRCIEWCYDRLEDGKLGDQKYLDDWPERFEGVHVLQHKGGGLAPWNIAQYDVRERDGSVLVDDDELVFILVHPYAVHGLSDALNHRDDDVERLDLADDVEGDARRPITDHEEVVVEAREHPSSKPYLVPVRIARSRHGSDRPRSRSPSR